MGAALDLVQKVTRHGRSAALGYEHKRRRIMDRLDDFGLQKEDFEHVNLHALSVPALGHESSSRCLHPRQPRSPAAFGS